MRLVHQSKVALGSDTTLCIVTDAPDAAIADILHTLWLTIYQFERKFSRFLPDSELSRFNRNAGQRTHVSPEFREVLLAAKEMSRITGGLFNPFILPALQRAGYEQSFVQKYAYDTQELYINRYVAQPEALEVGDSWALIPHATALDLGGCGKGYLADMLANLPIAQSLQGFWFSLGGDIRGHGTDAAGNPWHVRIQDAQRPQLHLETEHIGDPSGFAIASSGTIIRHGTHAHNSHWHHIIDPRTMNPADTDILLATVAHTSALQADVLASCVVILGSSQATTFLHDRHAPDALIQTSHQVIGKGLFGQPVRKTPVTHNRKAVSRKAPNAGSIA